MRNINENIFTLYTRMHIMRRFVLFAAIAVAILNRVNLVSAAELPTYELMGFPITPLQFSVLASASVQEASPVPTLMLRGMPASPHQIAVLTPYKKIIDGLAANPTRISVRRGATA
jgi:hypothetical protein